MMQVTKSYVVDEALIYCQYQIKNTDGELSNSILSCINNNHISCAFFICETGIVLNLYFPDQQNDILYNEGIFSDWVSKIDIVIHSYFMQKIERN